ncbi:AAA family ATPase [Aerosakkonemataceae cyanobacterium BLCC-F50]|uniref:histidine kinase n=1 Tax=Floridaenema flaviceps BLCC-F50 TaxID=3153642 RepID=A0ABV4XSN2_9CYAN
MSAIANLSGYQITEQLYAGTRTLVYRGIRTSDRHPVAIKILRNEYPNFSELVQLRNQYTIAKNLDFPRIIKALTLEVYRNGYALVMEDFGGISLSDYLLLANDNSPKSNYLPLLEFVKIAIQLTEALHYLYQNRVIHKDIKPANILIHPHSKQVKLIDFSIASLLPRETQEIQNPNVLEGTLAYLSPEQTGRMNRGIDYRTDFYALGVTFYELLTGQLPFISDDPMELVHGHLAEQPIPIHEINAEIPLVLSEIVGKLMAKNAEERYQTALGIKHDLEKCLTQLQEKGQIEYFEIRKRDLSDRFTIPEKLYGREAEVNQLLNSFACVANGTTEMMLVAGFSGIGKTAVVNEVHKPIVKQRGYFIKGKYDQFQRNIPFSAFVQAFRELMGQLLSESEAQIQTWKTNILTAVGENGQVLIDVIPELESIIGKQPPAIELSGTAAQNRFNLLLQKFVKVFTSAAHPLVMFLDDLQWADSASLNLLKLLMQDTRYLLILGAYRDNEVSPVHPFVLTVDEIVKMGATVNTITLPPLTQSDMNRLVADTLNCELSLADPLTQLVYQKTEGNPFFATQFLKALHNDNLISFNWNIQHWQCDIAQVKALAITDDVVEFMASQLQKLPKETQDVLKLAACIGTQFDLNTLAIVNQKSPESTATSLWKGLQETLVIPTTKIYKFFTQSDSEEILQASVNPTYRFLHDRVQQAAYSLIPTDQKQNTHLTIGLLLLNHTPIEEQDAKIFEIVNHLNLGLELIDRLDRQEQLAHLNWLAGQKAKNSAAYTAAIKYFSTGLQLLAPNKWQTQYILALNLSETLAEVAYLQGDFAKMNQVINEVLSNTNSLLDRVNVYETKIQADIVQNRFIDAVETTLEILHKLGFDFPNSPTQLEVQQALENTTFKLNQCSIESLYDLPEMTSIEGSIATRLLVKVLSATYIGKPELLPILLSEGVNLFLEQGNNPLSGFIYAWYGLIICSAIGDISTGYNLGELSLKLLDKFNAKAIYARTTFIVYYFIKHWKIPVRETLDSFLNTYYIGLETGDLEYAAWSIHCYSYFAYFAGYELTSLSSRIFFAAEAISQINQEAALNYSNIFRQSIINLLGNSNQPELLMGEAYNEAQMLPFHQNQNDQLGLIFLSINKLILCYLFSQYEQAIEYVHLFEQYAQAGAGSVFIPTFYFYASLVHLAIYSKSENSQQTDIIDRITSNQEKMRIYANHAPANCLHKFYLVEAERCRVFNQRTEAIEFYDRAISIAKENEYIQEEAIANELAAKFYLDWGKEKVAAGYMQEAYYCYARWGAKAKVAYLEQHFPQLLGAILQPINFAISTGGTIAPTPIRNVTIASSNENLWLDFPAVMKAAQAISEEIELEKLLATLMQIAINNAGAQTGILVINQEAELLVVAKANQKHTENWQIPLTECSELPQNLIYSVARSQTTAVFDNLSAEAQFAGDRYIITHQPKSALCTPISKQGKLIAILYLENNLTVGAFTSDRIETLKILTSQAAISIENARLYQKLEKYSQTLAAEVERKTEDLRQKADDLEQALKNLQQTQTQLIQSEKMSALGQLVAGIAHEINNPVNFIHGNLQHTENYVNNLLSLLELYQQEYLEENSVIQAKIEEIELEFIKKDLNKIFRSMKTGSERIQQIIVSLRNFSRLDEAKMKSVDLHSGIDSTLLILQNRFQGNNNQPKIQLIKEYGDLPLVTCYASEMNQVFLSIISNALDALKEVSKTNRNPFIKIQTEVEEKEWVRITITDNGNGIPADIQKRLFEPFFTTKPVGSGTGLGLSVSYAIVKKHGGQLICNSAIGGKTEFVIKIPIAIAAF